MKTDTPVAIRLADYQPPDFKIETVDLTFDLIPEETRVTAIMTVVRATPDKAQPLVLHGEDLKLISVEIDGAPVADNSRDLTPEALTLHNVADRFQLKTVVEINPSANTRLEGLYRSKTMYCTQCEAEGFRRITYFLDRPDAMATYRVTMRGDAATNPVLLSNGNEISNMMLPDGRREAVWEDPFPKPAYLFALVAGDLACVEDSFTTMNGRTVALKLYVEHGNETRCDYAMDALKRSMKWDEDRFGLEYDLDIFNIVAVSDFNMGAMENKSLNIFNAKYVLADPETATDMDFAFIESIVAHEYFHNWTGNRVTCRDWFQLSLKEGLTVFRDQEFSCDMRSRPVKRIEDVRRLRGRQFPEDAGPLAHPVRPDSYIEINNFYTATVYEKGAEVIGMMHTLLGEAAFQAGMRLYFDRHDGAAVTCEDFAAAMEDASGVDLGLFRRWYSQAGTPVVEVEVDHDPDARQLKLTFAQHTDPTPGQADKQPLHIPFRIGLIGPNGGELELPADAGAGLDEDGLLNITESRQELIIPNISEKPALSLNRRFTAPVKVLCDQSDAELAFLGGHDSDSFNRWESLQQLATRVILRDVARRTARTDQEIDNAAADNTTDPAAVLISDAIGEILRDDRLDPAFKALCCTLPSEDFIGDQMDLVAVDAIHAARKALRRLISTRLSSQFTEIYQNTVVRGKFAPTAEQAGIRALRNLSLAYLCAFDTQDATKIAKQHFDAADNMTDSIAALGLLCEMQDADAITDAEAALASFEAKWHQNEQVMDKWFAIQAMASRPGALARVRKLIEHPAFDIRNPNKVRSVIGAFAIGNALNFHAKDGSGYRFLADSVIELDSLNPQVAARLLGTIGTWRRYDLERQALMRSELERVKAVPVLSPDSFEIASKSLG